MALDNFALGLRVTGLGMGLVFATLIVIMLAIYLLERIFRGEPAEGGAEPGAAPVLDAARVTEASTSVAADEAAAIAVAVALERKHEEQAEVYDDEDVVGEVVMVTSIDPGTGAWRGYGRLKAMQ